MLPSEAKAVVWPMPYCPNDESVAYVEAFVRNGGSLYISGDIRYDEDRRPTRTERMIRLCGVKPVSAPDGDSAFPNPPKVESVKAKWQAPFWVNKLGKGTVSIPARQHWKMPRSIRTLWRGMLEEPCAERILSWPTPQRSTGTS